MTILKINQRVRREITDAGEAAFPDECCGFLLGTEQNEERAIRMTLAASNTREGASRTHRFLITPESFRQAEQTAKEQGLDVVGFYHSHPNAPAQPSAYDLEHAWPWYSYVIVSVKKGRAKEMMSWRLRDDRSKFEPERITFLKESLTTDVH